MPTHPARIAALIEGELSGLRDDELKQALVKGLVDPHPLILDWEYGDVGQQFEGWVVFDHQAESDTLIVYCESGFGPACPWGLIFATPDRGRRSMGMESGWFGSFIEAFRDSHAALPQAQTRP